MPDLPGFGRRQKTIEIDGVQYKITQLGATTGGQVMFRLGRAFAAIIAGLRVGNLTVDTLDPADFDFLVKVMQPTTDVGITDTRGDGQVKWHKLTVDFDEHFAGRYPQMLEWLKGTLEANFGPLQDALGSLFRGAAALSDSKPQKESTGSPGDSSSPPV